MKPLKHIIAVCTMLVLSCNTSTKELPILSYTIDDSGQKKEYRIQFDDFTNQLGASFSSEDMNNHICVVNFFFTSCPSICPPMRTELIRVAELFSETPEVLFISHTIDPDNDTVSVLKDYAEATGISHQKWQFLRASEAATQSVAKQYMTSFKPNVDDSDFYHSSYAALVDDTQHIRGFYDILIQEDMERLIEDLNQLLD